MAIKGRFLHIEIVPDLPSARPTNDISIKFEIRQQFGAISFKIYSTDHNEICTRAESVTVMMCAKFRCDWSSLFQSWALPILIEFRIRSKYRKWDHAHSMRLTILVCYIKEACETESPTNPHFSSCFNGVYSYRNIFRSTFTAWTE